MFYLICIIMAHFFSQDDKVCVSNQLIFQQNTQFKTQPSGTGLFCIVQDNCEYLLIILLFKYCISQWTVLVRFLPFVIMKSSLSTSYPGSFHSYKRSQMSLSSLKTACPRWTVLLCTYKYLFSWFTSDLVQTLPRLNGCSFRQFTKAWTQKNI